MARPKTIRTCDHCGSPRPARAWRHCSRLCTDAAKKKPRPTCEHCGTQTPHWKNRFCSIACKSAAQIEPPADRFWAKVEKTDGCWLWRGATSQKGYGEFNLNGRSRRATRVAWQLTTGEAPPPHMDVCHHCDNPPCVRHDHLFLGTRSDNVRDMMRKGRGRKALGERTGRSKLTADAVRFIRTEYAAGATMKVLARRFHVSDNSIGDVVNRLTWKHVG